MSASHFPAQAVPRLGLASRARRGPLDRHFCGKQLQQASAFVHPCRMEVACRIGRETGRLPNIREVLAELPAWIIERHQAWNIGDADARQPGVGAVERCPKTYI